MTSPEGRNAWLDGECAGDEELRREVENLLAHDVPSAPEGDEALAGTDESACFGDFRILREIGRGGMGVVYAARQISLDRPVALKILASHPTIRQSRIERFRREAMTVARLRHDGIVEVYAVGVDRGAHFFAMELVDGAPLDRVIDRLRRMPHSELDGARMGSVVETLRSEAVSRTIGTGERTRASVSSWNRSYVETACRLIVQVADALEHAHRAGIVHRDVKPANILVRGDSSTVLTDFGLARDEGLPPLSLTGEFAGTPHYVSPEQAMANRMRIDHRTDVYSLGVTLYELLTLRRPFEGETSQEVFAKIIAKEPPNPRLFNPSLPRDLVTIVLKAMEKDPDERYATVGALSDDLRAFLEYRAVIARRPSLWGRVRRFGKREPAKAVLILIIAMAVPALAGLGAYSMSVRRELIAAERAAQLQNVRIEAARNVQEALDLLGPAISSMAATTAKQRFEVVAIAGSGRPMEPRIAEDFEHMKRLLGQALRLDPESVDARAGLALVRLASGDAQGVLDVIPAQGSSRALVFDQLRAIVCIRSDRGEEGIGLFDSLPDPVSPLELYVAGIIELNRSGPGNPEGYQKSFGLLFKADDARPDGMNVSKLARPAFISAAMRLDADDLIGALASLLDEWPEFEDSSDYFFGSAVARVDPVQAIRVLEALRARSPQMFAPLMELGRLYDAQQDYSNAVEMYRLAGELDPLDFWTFGNASETCFRAGWYDEAAGWARRAIRANPKKGEGYHMLANALQALGESTEALEAVRDGIAEAPEEILLHTKFRELLLEAADMGMVETELKR